MINFRRVTEIVLCGALFAGCASMGGGASPAEIVKARQAGMKAVAGATGALKTQLAAPTPDMAAIKTSAANMSAAFKDIHKWWPESTKGEPSKSKPEVFTDKAGFKKQVDGVRAASAKLSAASKSGDVAAIRVAYAGFTDYCRTCHTAYRMPPARPAAK